MILSMIAAVAENRELGTSDHGRTILDPHHLDEAHGSKFPGRTPDV